MVLRILSREELKQIFDEHAVEVLDYFLEKAIILQPELLQDQGDLPIQIPKEHIEQWIVQAINAKSVGAGNYGVDIIKEPYFGADVKMLSCKLDKKGNLAESTSGETSLAQKFKDTGTSLDSLFQSQNYESILEGWKKILKSKLDGVKSKNELGKLYYFFFLRAGTTFYLCGAEVNINEIENIYVLENSNANNVYVGNFIGEKYGNVKIYKAKKRMELRLYPKYWVEEGMVIKFEADSTINKIDLRKLAVNGQLQQYKKECLKASFKGEILK